MVCRAMEKARRRFDDEEDDLLDEAEVRPSRRPRTLLLRAVRRRVRGPAEGLLRVGVVTAGIPVASLVVRLLVLAKEAWSAGQLPTLSSQTGDDPLLYAWFAAALLTGSITVVGAWS